MVAGKGRSERGSAYGCRGGPISGVFTGAAGTSGRLGTYQVPAIMSEAFTFTWMTESV